MKTKSPWLVLPVALLLSVFWSMPARADIFRLTYDDSASDPADRFEEECLGDTVAEDCDVRAALIEGELAALLSRLDSDPDPATLALFQAALELDSPVVQAMAARYVSRSETRPKDFFSKVRTFFWGPDAPLGVASADVLNTSGDEMDSRLAELYGEQRQSSDYGPAPILSEETPETEENDLVLACAKDTRLELMQSFAEEEVFEPAQRLLMYDRFAVSALEPGVSYPVTAFVTEASVDEVSEFFAKSFGKPIGPVADAAERMQALTERMLALQGPASRGDQDAIAEIQRIGDELAGLQELSTLSSFLQLQAIHAENDLIFLDGTVDDVLERPVRAVTVGSDEAAGGTVIRYINAPNGNGSGRPDPGAGQAGSPGGSGEPAGEGGASERPTAGSDDGCGCSVPGGSSNSSVIAVLPFLAAWLVRRARLRSSR